MKRVWIRFWNIVCSVLLRTVYGLKIEHKESVPEGGLLICANHSSWIDPLFVAQAVGIQPSLSIMAKKELFQKKVFGKFIASLGAFPVDREKTDITAVKRALTVLNKGERLLIFPEGTRSNRYHAKEGAGMFALRTGCTVLPVFVPYDKKPFGHRTVVIVGEPFVPEKPEGKPGHEDYAACAGEILRRVYALDPHPEHPEQSVRQP